MKAFISWSGGKETLLSCYRVMQARKDKIAYLLNMASEDGGYSRSHRSSTKLLTLQAKAIGLPIIQREASWGSYEEKFKKAVSDLKKMGIMAGVFGDIDLQGHRDWVEKICKEMEITPILPLWKEERKLLLEEFIDSGFKAIVIAVQTSLLGNAWLGRMIDKEFVDDLTSKSNIDISGENGEYHTFVYDGPIFKGRVRFSTGKKIYKGKNCFLELAPER